MTVVESIGWRIAVALADALLLLTSLVLSLWLRFDNQPLSWVVGQYISRHVHGIAAFTVFYMGVLYVFRMYKYAWLYAGLEAVRSLLTASMVGMLGLLLVQQAVFGEALPKAVLLMFWLISTGMIGSLRVLLRVIIRFVRRHELQKVEGSDNSEALVPTRALIVGSVDHGASILKAMNNTHSLRHYRVLGFLDDNPDKVGMIYSGVQVLGPTKILMRLLDEHEVDEVIFALRDDADGANMRDQVLECRKRKVLAKVVPNYAELITKPSHVRLEDIKVGDLLRRPMRQIDLESYAGYLRGKRVLVTGAGGSIGSEICRQVAKLGPSELVILGHGENSIFRIQQELSRNHPELSNNIFPIIASITNSQRVHRVFRRFRPEVVFHAAAHKHLPLMEYNVCEAVHNNVVGTNNLVEACIDHGVEHMVQISTDKAADPSSVMGATKWLCESVVRSSAKEYHNTSFVCVRFGNVLGSRGSVIPVFDEQIRSGGPVTVTHPEMTRYFMTIPEAVRLVIQAGAVGKSGDVYLLDMGKPVRILDLAEDMIRLNGLEPYVDIAIEFTGIRPGEKMHEQLASERETVQATAYDGLNQVQSEPAFTRQQALTLVADLQGMVDELDGGGILAVFEKVIPGYANSARAVFTRLVS